MRAPLMHGTQYMQHSGHGGAGGQRMNAPYGPNNMSNASQRPPNVQVGSDGMPINPHEWRQFVIPQQQNFNSGNIRPGFNTNQQGTQSRIEQFLKL